MLSREVFLERAIAYKNGELDVSNMSHEDMKRLQYAVNAVDVLQIEELTSALNCVGHMSHRIGGWPTNEASIYDHFDTCIDKWGGIVSIMQPYDHVLTFDIRQELAYIAAGIVLRGGPFYGFVGLLGHEFSWHYPDSTVLIAHTCSPSRSPEDFTHLLYYHFDSSEAAWWYLASHGKRCSDRIIWFNETECHSWDQWWMEIYSRGFAQYPWVVGGGDSPFVFSDKTACDAYGFKCR